MGCPVCGGLQFELLVSGRSRCTVDLLDVVADDDHPRRGYRRCGTEYTPRSHDALVAAAE